MYTIYFAGDLFDQKHITGNYFLAKKIYDLSQGKYKCVLPQNWEGEGFDSAVGIRNKDIAALISSDLGLFNFDGVDLDSGTVVEFMAAKMLDIPSVLLRTDVRERGYLFNEDWNIMLTGFPRCENVKHSALGLYNNIRKKDIDIDQFHETIALSIIKAFDKVLEKKSFFISFDEAFYLYQHLIKMCGGEIEKDLPEERLRQIVLRKLEKNIYGIKKRVETPAKPRPKVRKLKAE